MMKLRIEGDLVIMCGRGRHIVSLHDTCLTWIPACRQVQALKRFVVGRWIVNKWRADMADIDLCRSRVLGDLTTVWTTESQSVIHPALLKRNTHVLHWAALYTSDLHVSSSWTTYIYIHAITGSRQSVSYKHGRHHVTNEKAVSIWLLVTTRHVSRHRKWN